MNRDFLLLCVGQGFSRLGTRCLLVALPLLVLRATGSPWQAGLVEAVWGIAFLVTCLPAGALADRLNRRTVMLISDLGCVAASLLLVAGVVTGRAGLAWFLVVVVAFGICGPLFDPAAAGSIRRIVPAAQLSAALTVNQIRNQVAQLAGPALGGLLFALDPAAPFLLNAAGFGASACGVLLIRTRLARPEQPAVDAARGIGAGIRFLARSPGLRTTLLASAVANFCLSGVLLAVVFVVARPGAGGGHTGLVITIAMAGSLVGASLGRQITARFSIRQVVIYTSVVYAVAVPVLAGWNGDVVCTIVLGVCLFVSPSWSIVLGTYQMLVTPDHLQGRVQSAVSFSALVITPAGQLAAGGLYEHAGARTTFATFGLCLAALAVAAPLSRSLRRLPTLTAPAPDRCDTPAPPPASGPAAPASSGSARGAS